MPHLTFKAKTGLSVEERGALLQRLENFPQVKAADWNSDKGTGTRGMIVLAENASEAMVADLRLSLANEKAIERPVMVPPLRTMPSPVRRSTDG